MIVYLCDKCHARRGELETGWQSSIEVTPLGMKHVLLCPTCTENVHRETWNAFWQKLRDEMGIKK